MSMATTRPSGPTTSRAKDVPYADLKGPVPLPQVERLVEQRIAMRARDRGALAWEREGDLFVGVVPVARRDEVLTTHGEHRPAEALGAKEPAPLELPDLRFPLPPQILVALDWLARRRNEPSVVHRRSEEHTSELQSRPHLVCRLL